MWIRRPTLFVFGLIRSTYARLGSVAQTDASPYVTSQIWSRIGIRLITFMRVGSTRITELVP